MVEAVTVCEKRLVPFWDQAPAISAPKFFNIKILPVSDCAP